MKLKKNNKFYTIFNSLTISEKTEFCEFLRLSFIRKPRLSDIIIEKIESGKDLHFYLESIYSKRSMWNIYSELTGALGQYIALKGLFQDEKEMNKLKRGQLIKKNLGKIAISEFKNEIKTLQTSEFSFLTFKKIQENAGLCVFELIKNGLSGEFYGMNKMNKDFKILNAFLEIIFYSIDELIRIEFYGEKSGILTLNILEFLEIKKIHKLITDEYPEYKDHFEILLNMLSSLSNPADYMKFKMAKDQFLINTHKFSPEYRADQYMILINICNIFANRTKRNMNLEMFELLKSKIENGLVDDLKVLKIGENHFRDYVYVALKANDDIWAEDFLNKYSELLPASIRDNNVNTALAFINYHRKNYSKAITYIKKIERSFFINDLDYYTIQIFSTFDTENFTECFKLKKRFQEYVNNNSKLPEVYKNGITNFLRILKALLNYKETGKNKYLIESEYSVTNTTEVLWRIWLNSKLNEINQRN